MSAHSGYRITGIRPTCEIAGCSNQAQDTGKNRTTDGTKVYRHHTDIGFVCSEHHAELTGRKKGMSKVDWRNSFHPSLRYRKKYCENTDGRLGYTCTSNIVWDGMLDVDHKDGNHLNNTEENLQTLCKCCHAYKSNINKDYKSPGRKTRIPDNRLTQFFDVL